MKKKCIKGLKRSMFIILLILFSALFSFALGPHEILVLVNKKSANSIKVAEEFISLRGVPEINVIPLQIPDTSTNSPMQITHDDFTKFIWVPVIKEIKKRGISDHILAWVYSTDFPISIKVNPIISIQGITFLRNKLPSPEDINKGTFYSPLFAGPDGFGKASYAPQTFDIYRQWLGSSMPIPSMMLGYIGKRGNSIKEILKCLRKGAISDSTMPTGTVYFVTGNDIRSKCRAWQYPLAQRELKALGVNAVITDKLPTDQTGIIGLLMGSPSVIPNNIGYYRPGAMTEHLTSAAAIFHSNNQTKLTAWIKAGATASAGTVVEPFSLWTKFPNARFFIHYVHGCSIIESFFQSIRSPLQILLVGDPLAQPWAPETDMILYSEEASKKINTDKAIPVSGFLKITVDVKSNSLYQYRKFLLLLDGKSIPDNIGKISEKTKLYGKFLTRTTFEINTTKIKNGKHSLRIIAYQSGLIRNQTFKEIKILTKNEIN